LELARVNLEDKYTLQSGRIYLTGIQALVRLPLMRRARDRAAGLKTAGFIYHALCVEIASVPGKIRGYGHIKARNVEAAKACEAE
jgi:hypothetical protein